MLERKGNKNGPVSSWHLPGLQAQGRSGFARSYTARRLARQYEVDEHSRVVVFIENI